MYKKKVTISFVNRGEILLDKVECESVGIQNGAVLYLYSNNITVAYPLVHILKYVIEAI